MQFYIIRILPQAAVFLPCKRTEAIVVAKNNMIIVINDKFDN